MTRFSRISVLLLAGMVFLLQACSRSSPEERAYVRTLMQLRTEKDQFLQSPDGPLTDEQRPRFKGLSYYPPNFELRFDVALQPAAVADTVRFPTSQNTFDLYVRRGTFHFEAGGREQELTLFAALQGGHWFMPFADRTSGRDTYGAGRYLDPEPLPDGRFRLDFNRAYNPYCAYNAKWICPLPPPENRLDIAIEAGERNFPLEGH